MFLPKSMSLCGASLQVYLMTLMTKIIRCSDDDDGNSSVVDVDEDRL